MNHCVINTRTGEVFATYSTEKQATRHARKLCSIYGPMRYGIEARPITTPPEPLAEPA